MNAGRLATPKRRKDIVAIDLLSLGFHPWFTVAGYYRSAPFARFLSLGSLHWVTLPGFTHAGFPSLGSRRWDIVARLRLSAL